MTAVPLVGETGLEIEAELHGVCDRIVAYYRLQPVEIRLPASVYTRLLTYARERKIFGAMSEGGHVTRPVDEGKLVLTFWHGPAPIRVTEDPLPGARVQILIDGGQLVQGPRL